MLKMGISSPTKQKPKGIEMSSNLSEVTLLARAKALPKPTLLKSPFILI